MAVLAECDICGSQHRVKEGLVGQTIRCKDCGVQIVVPADHLITPETFIEEGGRLQRREPLQTPSIWPGLIAGFVACLVLMALVGFVWILFLL